MDLLAARPDAAELFRYAASGFRDFTRIAAGSPEMWRDISLANREALMQRDRRVSRRSSTGSPRWSRPGDGAALEAVFARASVARREWGARFGQGTAVAADGPREP